MQWCDQEMLQTVSLICWHASMGGDLVLLFYLFFKLNFFIFLFTIFNFSVRLFICIFI